MCISTSSSPGMHARNMSSCSRAANPDLTSEGSGELQPLQFAVLPTAGPWMPSAGDDDPGLPNFGRCPPSGTRRTRASYNRCTYAAGRGPLIQLAMPRVTTSRGLTGTCTCIRQRAPSRAIRSDRSAPPPTRSNGAAAASPATRSGNASRVRRSSCSTSRRACSERVSYAHSFSRVATEAMTCPSATAAISVTSAPTSQTRRGAP